MCASRRTDDVEVTVDLPHTRHTVNIVAYKEARIQDQSLKIKNLREPRPDGGCSEGSQRRFLILRPAFLRPAKFKSRGGVSIPPSEGRFLISETGQIDLQWGGWTFFGAILLLAHANTRYTDALWLHQSVKIIPSWSGSISFIQS